MVNRLLASRRLVEAVHGAGGEVYVWTVDDARAIRRFEQMGADGVITNDPRLFEWRRCSPDRRSVAPAAA